MTNAANVTKAQIDKASTKDLQGIYLAMVGKPTSNRNAAALRARLLGMLDKRAQGELPVVQAPGHKVPEPRIIETRSGPVLTGPAPAKPEQARAFEKRVSEKLGKRMAAREAKPRIAYQPGQAPTKPARKPRAPRAAQLESAERQRTKAMLAGIPAGIELYHTYRDGTETRVKVLEAVGADGRGGRFEWMPKGKRKPIEVEELRGLRGASEFHRRRAPVEILEHAHTSR